MPVQTSGTAAITTASTRAGARSGHRLSSRSWHRAFGFAPGPTSYTLRASVRALSVRSQVKLGSVRPKWPYVAVSR